VEFGGIFILLVVLALIAVAGVLVFGIAARLRRAKLDPERDRLEQADPGSDRPPRRPRHVRAEGEQRSRFLAHR
jgi:hypothetical protein